MGKQAGRCKGTTEAEGYSVSGGRPEGTTEADGYCVSGRRPEGTTEAEGYSVGKDGGRPEGNTEAEGYCVGKDGGRAEGTTEAKGHSVGKEGGRPEGTTEAEGYSAGKEGGRPKGTTEAEGYSVGKWSGRLRGTTRNEGYDVKGQGRPDSMKSELAQFPEQDLPSLESTCNPDFSNLTEDMLRRCTRRVVQQRRFNKKALADAMCWQCGKVLWSSVDSVHTFLVEPPQGLCAEDAPASAYWYSCSYCHSKNLPSDMHVRLVFDSNITDIKPVREWDVRKPQPVAALTNRYETGQVSLLGLFSTSVKDAGFAQWKHIQVEVSAIH